MSTGAARLDLKLFIDGYEIPVSSMQASFADGAPANAAISVIPTDKFFEIKPRSLVCLFYLHTGYELPYPMNIEKSTALDYKLLFVGEYVGYQFQKSPSGRVAQLTCSDLTNYFDSIKQHMVNYKTNGLAMTENAFIGVQFDTSKKTTLGKDIAESVTNWINASKVGGKVSPALGIQRVIRESFFSSNIYWAKAYNKTRVGETIVALPEDTSSSELFNFRAFKKFIRMVMGQGGSLASLRQMLGIISSPILYNSVTIPCPIYREDDTYLGMTRAQINQTSLKKVISERSKETLASTIWKPDFWFAPPPACNCVFPDQYMSMSFGRAFLQEPTRLQLRTEIQMRRHQYVKNPAVYSPWQYTFGGGVPLYPAQYGVTSGAHYLRDRTYAPNFEGFKELLKSPKKGGGYKARLHEVLLPHEKFVGPNTVMVGEGAFSRYATLKERRQYYSFYTDYLFWKYYYGSRGGQINMKFNPNIVPGFSCVVFDRFDEDNPVHFIGYVTAVSHSIGQGGASTSVNLVAMRPYKEVVDFDGTGRNLEDIIYSTSAKFYDRRYFPDKIGDEFYKPLLGCGSIFEVQKALDYSVEATYVTNDAIDSINSKYVELMSKSTDIHKFIASLTQRIGKANIVNLFGTDDEGFPTNLRLDDNGATTLSSKMSSRVEGFFRGAIDKDSKYAEIKYESTSYSFSTKTVPGGTTVDVDFDSLVLDPAYLADFGATEEYEALGLALPPGVKKNVQEFLPSFTGPNEVVATLKQIQALDYGRAKSYASHLLNHYVAEVKNPDQKKRVRSSSTSEKSYNIGDEIEERQSVIKEYVESLLFRGLKI